MSETDLPRSPDRRHRAADASVIVVALLLGVGALWLGRDVFVPITLSVIVATVLWPAVQALQRLRLPTPAAATIVVVAGLVLVVAVGAALQQPVRGMAEGLPKGITAARARLDELAARFRSITGGARAPSGSAATGSAARRDSSTSHGADSTPGQSATPLPPATAIRSAFGVTTALAAEIVEEVLLVLFLLAAGGEWTAKLARIAASSERARRWTSIAGDMHDVVARYLLVTLYINIGQAIVIGLAIWAIGLPAPLLWAVLTFLAEFIPYLGGLTMVALLLLTGLTMGQGLAHALLAPAAYLIVTTLQNNLVSPVAYGRGLRLNPTAILISVMFWWMIWGVAGAFVAVPILASLRVLGSHVPALAPLCVLLEE
ncbi:MAG: AI-2E family transporter [Gemmatimonadaceae bacterium]